MLLHVVDFPHLKHLLKVSKGSASGRKAIFTSLVFFHFSISAPSAKLLVDSLVLFGAQSFHGCTSGSSVHMSCTKRQVFHFLDEQFIFQVDMGRIEQRKKREMSDDSYHGN